MELTWTSYTEGITLFHLTPAQRRFYYSERSPNQKKTSPRKISDIIVAAEITKKYLIQYIYSNYNKTHVRTIGNMNLNYSTVSKKSGDNLRR